MKDFSKLIVKALDAKRIEPKPRLVGGAFGYASHRFPIKDGISRSRLIAENIQKSNVFLERMKKGQ